MRNAEIRRDTKETAISLRLEIDGAGQSNISTGIAYFDHMLTGFAKHGLFDLDVNCAGDLVVDDHHSIEDCGIVLGSAIKKAVGEKQGIVRYGSCILPMDETLVLVAIDLSGRPYFSFDGEFRGQKMGEMETAMVREFFYAVSYTAEMNLHMKILDGQNDHHKAEALFKAFAKALDAATRIDPRIEGPLTTKGAL